MRILNFRLEPPGSGRSVLARFDVGIAPGVTLFDLALRENSQGQMRTLIPETRARVPAAIIDPLLLTQVTAAAVENFNLAGGAIAHDVNHPA